MNINFITRWRVTFGVLTWLLLMSFAGLMFLAAFLLKRFFQVDYSVSTVIMACAAVVLFGTAREYLVALADKLIFNAPDLKSLLEGIEKELVRADSFDAMGAGISKKFLEIWDIEHAGLVVWLPAQAHYEPFPKSHFQNSGMVKLKAIIKRDDFLIRTLETEKRLFKYGIVTEAHVTSLGNKALPGERITFWKIRRTMDWLKAAICVPLLFDSQLVGFIVLGERKEKKPYGDHDKKFLFHISKLISPFLAKMSRDLWK